LCICWTNFIVFIIILCYLSNICAVYINSIVNIVNIIVNIYCAFVGQIQYNSTKCTVRTSRCFYIFVRSFNMSGSNGLLIMATRLRVKELLCTADTFFYVPLNYFYHKIWIIFQDTQLSYPAITGLIVFSTSHLRTTAVLLLIVGN